MARVGEQHDERGERQHEHGEVELCKVQHEPVDRRPRPVAAVRGDAVVAENRRRRAPARNLGHDDDHRRRRDDPVQGRERLQPLRAPALDPREGQRCGEHRGDDCDRLCARLERDGDGGEEEQLPAARRPLERGDEREREPEEDGIEDVLGHERSRVHGGRERNCERCGDERGGQADNAAGEQVCRKHRRADDERVHRLRPAVDVAHRADRRIHRRQQERVDEAVVRVHAPDEEVARLREAPCHVGVDELVDHDPRRGHAQRELHAHGDGVQRPQPGPDGHRPGQTRYGPRDGTRYRHGTVTRDERGPHELGRQRLRVEAGVGRCGRDLLEHGLAHRGSAGCLFQHGHVLLGHAVDVVVARDERPRSLSHRRGRGRVGEPP